MTYRWPGEPGEPPENPPTPPPRGSAPVDPRSDLPLQSSATGVAIPIVYGTTRVAGNLLERYAYTFAGSDTPVWLPSHGYTAPSDIVYTNGNLYICTTSGTSASSGSGPSGTGSGISDNTCTWSYVRMGYRHEVVIGFCEGEIYGVGKAWQDKNSYSAYTSLPHEAFYITLALGTAAGATRPNFIPAGATDIYANTVVLFVYLNTGSDADLAQISLEVQGIFADATHVDANPADIAVDLLTHARRGAQWPSARVDSVSTGTGNAASWKNYCTAAGFVLSWAIEQQTSGLELLKLLLAATNSDATMTNRGDGLGWMIRFVPRGTDAITANGATFTPNLTPAFALTADDILDPVQMDSIADTDKFNSFPVQYIDRAGDYASRIVDDPDMSDVDIRDLVRAGTSVFPMVLAPEAAIQLSRLKAQRSLNVRNTYRFSLPYRFLLVEPTDLLTVTDNLIGLSNLLVRVTAIEEDQESGIITIEAEDFPANVGAAAFYTPQTGDGFKPTVTTALGALRVLPGQAGGATVPDSSSTRGAAIDNMWPNPTSETNPPDGSDLTQPEWAFRVNAGVGSAYAGRWVREVDTVTHPGTVLFFSPIVPCHEGERVFFKSQIKIVTKYNATFGKAILQIAFLDVNGTPLQYQGLSDIGTTGAWRLLDLNNPSAPSGTTLAPAGTVAMRAELTAQSAKVQFDQITLTKDSPQELWNAPTLTNSWVNVAGGVMAAGYMRDDLGFVHLRGSVNGGTAGATIFTLPTDYRPSATVYGRVRAWNGSAEVSVTISVTSAGVVYDSNAAIGGAGQNLSLDGISFDTR